MPQMTGQEDTSDDVSRCFWQHQLMLLTTSAHVSAQFKLLKNDKIVAFFLMIKMDFRFFLLYLQQ